MKGACSNKLEVCLLNGGEAKEGLELMLELVHHRC